MPRSARSNGKSKRKTPPASVSVPTAQVEAAHARRFPIIGIGASAGGYEAFVQLLQSLPADTGMAFVLLMHLEPEHKSMLAKLLSNVTPMHVSEARNGVPVEPDHVYVIPPKADIAIRAGVLQIVGRRQSGGRHVPIDYFLTSLAEERRGLAIGVILSGTGSDGTQGLKAIKAEGGITFAQDEESAKHYGMPNSAIAAGCVDFILSPARIGEELNRLARHPYIGVPHSEAPGSPSLAPLVETDSGKILHLLRSVTGVDFTDYKSGTIRRRTARRMALLRIENLSKYLRRLQSDRAELDALFQDILIHVTGFFREPEAFKILQTKIFPKILAGKANGEAIRIWVPGCSTGEEVYSLVIAFLEFLGERASSTPIQAFGTDVSELAIEKARSGAYPESSLRDVSPARLRRFFIRSDGGYRVNKSVREMCIFARQDLTKDPPFSRIDLVSCRNVLIYMGAPLQKRVVAGFHYALRDGGYLLLGKSETLTYYPELFTPAERKARVFSKKQGAGRPAPDFTPMAFERPHLALPAPEEPAFDAQKEADRLVWQRYSHAGLVLNDDLEILHFRGDTSPFVAPAAGKASLNALRMVNDDLKMELRSAIHRARRSNANVRSTGLRIRHNGSAREIDLEVEPIIRPGGKDRYFLVLFSDSRVKAPLPPETASESRRRRSAENRELIQLRRELEASREYVQSIVEQQEASNEELKSANEEILSSNEELQSTNEELETAKEELQSTNEELVTLNETLQNRNAELGKLSDDLYNVLDGADIPILIVGEDGRIRRFTPSAGSLLNLLPGDVGRPISNIRPNIECPDLHELIEEVSRTFTEQQHEVLDKDGRWYSMRIRPYRTAENKIDGVLIVLVEIDKLKRSNQALAESEAMVRALVENLLRAILVIDQTGKIVMVNAALEKMFGYHRDEMLGQTLEILLPARLRDDHAIFRSGYFKAPSTRLMGAGREIVGRRKDGSEFPAQVSLSHIQISNAPLAVAFLIDRTEQRRTEAALAESETALRFSDQQLQKFTASLLTAQEEERERLAGELHDDLNQRLAALAIKAGTLEQQLPPDSRILRREIQGFRLAVDQLSEDVRTLAHELHPSVLNHVGLAKALRSYCDEFSKSRDVRIRYRQRDMPDDLSHEVALCLYRVAQEALANVARHSGVKAASVLLAGAGGRVHLAVHDDGVGFDPLTAHAGLGLISMRERVRLVGGTLTIKTHPGQGSRIEASVPLSGKPA